MNAFFLSSLASFLRLVTLWTSEDKQIFKDLCLGGYMLEIPGTNVPYHESFCGNSYKPISHQKALNNPHDARGV
jgi:hypothetical protein